MTKQQEKAYSKIIFPAIAKWMIENKVTYRMISKVT